jgi:dihydroorotate dehydrogenase (fumarate)
MYTNTEIAGVKFESYVFNASGPNDETLPQLELIAQSGSSAIMMKSCTLEPRIGNEEPRLVITDDYVLQAMGLPNLGYLEYIKIASQLKMKYDKPVIASVSGLSLEDNVIMIRAFQESKVDMIELNLSCPNIKGKSQTGYDFEQSDKLLNAVYKLGDKPLGLKLPPYFDPVHQMQMAELIKKYNISFITCINSVGNTLVIDPETESTVIKPKGGFGGLSDIYIKQIGVANVRAFNKLLGNDFPIIGVGGIRNGSDAFEYLLAGACAVQIGSTFLREHESSFGRIDNELADILMQKGCTSIRDKLGKLIEI